MDLILVFSESWFVMEYVILTRQLNLIWVGDIKMVKRDVRHVKFLFILMDYSAHVVIYDYVDPHVM